MDPPKPGARAPRNVAEETEAEERGWSWVVSKENSGKGTTGVLGYAARGTGGGYESDSEEASQRSCHGVRWMGNSTRVYTDPSPTNTHQAIELLPFIASN